MGWQFEDFTAGRTVALGARRITAEDIRAFADVSGDRNPLHLDAEYARSTPFGGPVAHGTLGIAVAAGLLQQSGITRDVLVALAGLEWRFLAPVRPDDVVAVEMEVLDRRPARQADRGLVRLRLTLRNEAGQVVQEGVVTEVLRRR